MRSLISSFVVARYIGVFVLALISISACSKNSPTGPNQQPPTDPNVNPPGAPPNIPQGTTVTSATGGYFTIKDAVFEPGSGSELKPYADGKPRPWRVEYDVCIAEGISDGDGEGFWSSFGPADNEGETRSFVNASTVFIGGFGPLRAGECKHVKAEGLIHGGSWIPSEIPKIIFYLKGGKYGGAGSFSGPDGKRDRILADANFKKGG